jgi:hypothetical protein
MQTVTPNMQTALDKGRVDPRILIDLYEFYDADYVPGMDGFDPDDATERFAAVEITWNGNAYRRELKGRSDITKSIGEKTNTVSLNFSNISRYMATLAQTTQIEGLWCVVRTVAPSVTDDSLVQFWGRCDKPSDIDKEAFTLSVKQDFGNINSTAPPSKFDADDPEGVRLQAICCSKGFHCCLGGAFVPSFTAQRAVLYLVGKLFGIGGRKQNTHKQFSSVDGSLQSGYSRSPGRQMQGIRFMGRYWLGCVTSYFIVGPFGQLQVQTRGTGSNPFASALRRRSGRYGNAYKTIRRWVEVDTIPISPTSTPPRYHLLRETMMRRLSRR